MTILWIILIVVLVLALLGFFGRGTHNVGRSALAERPR
jgi:hypothetical protein